MDMAYRSLGRTGVRVSALCLGNLFFGERPEEQAEEEAILDRALDVGINFLDTAASYGYGESVRRIGVVLRKRGGLPRNFVLATKADRDLKTGDFSGDQFKRSVERSLRLLGLDRLQLVYMHDPEHTTFEESMAPGGPVDVLQRLREEGVIEHVGVAGGPIDMMKRYVETDLFEVAISHNRFTLLNRSADELWNVCKRRGVAGVNAAPYGSGILVKGPDAYPRYAYQHAGGEMVDRVRRLEDICNRHGVPLGAAALQFSTRDSRIVSTIVGISSPDHLSETVRLAQVPIPDELWTELDTVAYTTEDPEANRFK